MLDEDAGLEQMPAARVGDVVGVGPVGDVVGGRRRAVVAERGQAGYGNRAHVRRAGEERQRALERVGGELLEPQDAVRETRRVQQRGRHHPLVLGGEKLIAGRRVGPELRQRDRAGRQQLPRLVDRVADEDRVLLARLQIDAPLTEVLPRRPVEDVDVLRDAAAEIRPVRDRIQIEVRLDGGIHRARADGGVRHRRRERDAEIFLQTLVAAEEEDAIPADRAADRDAELVPLERRRVADVEVVRRVEPAVAEEFERRPVVVVAARFGRDADDAAHRAAVVRRERVRDDAELADRVDAERAVGSGDRRDAGVALHVRAVDQEAVRPAAHPVDVQLHPARARRGARLLREVDDAGLQRGEGDVVAAVQRQLLDRLLRHERGERRRLCIDEHGAGRHGDAFLRRAHLERHDEPGLLRDGELDRLHARVEALQRDADFVLARRQAGEREAAVGVRHRRSRDSGVDVLRHDVGPRQHPAGVVFDGAGDAGGGDLRERGRCAQQDESENGETATRAAMHRPPAGGKALRAGSARSGNAVTLA